MNAKSNLIAVGVVLALGAGQSVWAAAQEEDSVYKWGRWAVLSPAAGGPPPYVAALTPDAVNNARPEEADEFSPKVLGLEAPVPVPGPVEPPPGDPRDRLPPAPIVEIPEPVPGPIDPPTSDPRDRLPPIATQ